MNIGVDIRALSTRRFSGVGNYIVNSLKHIFELDKVNHYYLFSSGLKNRTKDWLDFKQANVHQVHFCCSNKLLNLSLLTNCGPDLSKKFPVKLDLMWLPNINFFKFNKEIPTILTIHDLSFLHNREFYSLKRRYWHYLVNVRKLISNSNKVIAVSNNTQRDIMRFFTIAQDKVKVIYPGVEAKKIDEITARQLIAEFNLPAKYFLYVGTIEPRKNIRSIIKAFDKYHLEYPETGLVIVGGRGWVYRHILRSISKRPYVYYLGYCSGIKKDALYFLSQGLIWPSFYEGFGFPPLEATYQGVPSIISYKTSLPEILKDQAVYVDPYNVSDIYESLKELTEDSELVTSIKESAQEFKIPNWHDQAKQIIKLFNEVK